MSLKIMTVFIITINASHAAPYLDMNFLNILSDEAVTTRLQPSSSKEIITIPETTLFSEKESELLAKIVSDKLETVLSHPQKKALSTKQQIKRIEKNLALAIEKKRLKSMPKKTKKQSLHSLESKVLTHKNSTIITPSYQEPTSFSSTQQKMKANGFTLDSLMDAFSESIELSIPE